MEIVEGVKLIGINAETGLKLLFTLVFITVLWLLHRLSYVLVNRVLRGRHKEQARFWMRQGVNLATALLLLLGLLSI